MTDEAMRQRLKDAIDEAGKSARAVSLAAGLGPGYVHSILKEGKDPTIERLMAVCKAVPVSPVWILYGLDVEPEDVDIIRAMRDSPETRDGILAILRARGAR